jgi:hypothetical protein
MHNHNEHGNNGHNSWMMWLMMLPCILIAIFALAGSGKIFSSDNWQWLIWISVMIGAHALMMKFMHRHGENKPEEKEEKIPPESKSSKCK